MEATRTPGGGRRASPPAGPILPAAARTGRSSTRERAGTSHRLSVPMSAPAWPVSPQEDGRRRSVQRQREMEERRHGFEGSRPARHPEGGLHPGERCGACRVASARSVLRDLADEPAAEQIAVAIVAAQQRSAIRRTGELARIIMEATGASRWRLHPRPGQWNLHPAARTFQALRILVNRELAIDLELFSRGGQEILNAIERQGFDVLRSRPVISKPRKLALVLRAAAGKLLPSRSGQDRPVAR